MVELTEEQKKEIAERRKQALEEYSQREMKLLAEQGHELKESIQKGEWNIAQEVHILINYFRTKDPLVFYKVEDEFKKELLEDLDKKIEDAKANLKAETEKAKDKVPEVRLVSSASGGEIK